MSLYNMVMGENPIAELLLKMLGTTRGDVPRYRDAWLSDDGSEIIIHTRTGGGNREFYESEADCQQNFPEYFNGNDDDPQGPWNCDLRQLPGFINDSDDTFDATYADFHYNVPQEFQEFIQELLKLNDSNRGTAGLVSVIDKLKAGDTEDDRVKRAIEVGEKIVKQILPKVEQK